MNPAEREKMSVCLLHCMGKIRQRNTKAYYLVIFFPDNHRHQVITKHRNIHIDIIVNLLLSQFGEAIQRSIRFIQRIEHLMCIWHDFLGIFEFHDLQAILLLDDLTNPLVFLGNTFTRNEDLELMPVLILHISHAFHVLRIIREIINGRYGSNLIKTIYQHTFVIHIRKPHRTLQFFHAFLFGPVFNRFE